MQSFNRGEWSELYGVLYLLVKPKLTIVDSEFKKISKEDIFTVQKIILESTIKLEYEIVDNYIFVYISNKQFASIEISEIEKNRNILLEKILNAPARRGAFEIPSIDEFLNRMSNGNIIKAKSGDKSDIKLFLYDNLKSDNIFLKYSIKSSLGSPATILNASDHTNFVYRVSNLSKSQINEVNKINTRTKLLDRVKKIESYNGNIVFERVQSISFEYNLKIIDSNMPSYLGNALLYSYIANNKNLKEIFICSNDFEDRDLGLKKLADFIEGISFGMFPSEKWNGENSVNGGLLIIKSDGDIVFLDLMYFRVHVRNYIINNTKLDSPSSTRYHMLEIREDDIGYYFTLNLQIRYMN